MPYVTQGSRARMDRGSKPRTSGELNYYLTTTILDYLGDNPNYDMYNSVLGVLEAVKLELYRRLVAPYEETKIRDNGDLPGYSQGNPTTWRTTDDKND